MSSKYHIKIKVQKKEAKSITQSQPLITPETPATTAHQTMCKSIPFPDHHQHLLLLIFSRPSL